MKKKSISHKETFAILGFALGILSLSLEIFALISLTDFILIPLFSLFSLVAGLVFSIIGLKSKKKGLAIAGLIITGILLLIFILELLLALTVFNWTK